MAKAQERDGALIWTLPDEALLAVLENLTAQWDRQSWCLVCKKFRDLEAMSRKYVGLMRAEILEPVLRRYHHVEHLDLSSCVGVKDVCLITIAKFTSQQLLSITLHRVKGFGVVGVRSLVECTFLREVDLSFCGQVRDEEVTVLSRLQFLQKLELLGCKYVTDVGLSAVSNFKELKTLGLSFCARISDVGIQEVAAGCLQLRNIDLSHTKVSDKGMVFLALLRHLECLNLSYSSVTDEGLKHFKTGCTTLQKLDVSGCLPVSSFGIAALTERSVQLQHLYFSYCKLTSFSTLQNLKMLQVIKLGSCSLDEANLSLVGRECRELKELSLSKCGDVTDVGVASVVTTLTGLQKLDLTCCFDITDVALKAVTTNCRGLLSLHMEGCLSVTAKGLVLIGKFCLALEDLDLSACKLNDDGLKSIARCIELRFLRIGSCMDITNAGLVRIGATCKNLLEFDCSRSRRVGDEGIIAMASGCKRLKRVVMLSCQFVTDASLQSLASLRDLVDLVVRDCQVTSVGVCHIAESCKHLRELDVRDCTLVGDLGILAISQGCQNLRKIWLSFSAVTKVGMMAVANMPCLQSVDMDHMLCLQGMNLAHLKCN